MNFKNNPCSLCLRYKPLCDSHILPEFLYRPAYNHKHTAIKVDVEKNKKGKTQKGITELMLCKGCEKILNEWETYFARVWFHKEQRIRPIKIPSQKIINIQGLDYKKFKLFHLSILWRAGVSKRKEFEAVRLGNHAEKLREMLVEENPGEPEDYQFISLALRDPKTSEFCNFFLRGFESSKLIGHHIYSVIFGGVIWAYKVSSHRFNRQIPICFIKNGTLTMAVQDWDKNPSVLDLASKVRSFRNKKSNNN